MNKTNCRIVVIVDFTEEEDKDISRLHEHQRDIICLVSVQFIQIVLQWKMSEHLLTLVVA